MSEPAPLVIQGLNIEAFERLVHHRDGTPEAYNGALLELLGALQKIRQGSGFFGVPESDLPMLYTRLASAITTLFCDPKFGLSPDGFSQLMAQHSMLHAIFRASAFETMDHVLSCFGARHPDHPEKMDFSGNDVAKMLVCWSLDSSVDVDFEAVAAVAPGYAATAIIGMLSIGGTHSEKSYARRLMLMRLRGIVGSQPLHMSMITCAGDAYMHCSYTDAHDKHEIKRVINGRMRDMLERTMGLTDTPRKLVRKDRPTIVIPIEWFGSYHAMYRCYAPSILQLKERFRLVGIYREKEIDDVGRATFDKGIALGDENMNIQSVLEAINSEEPDIIYYPSLGMAAWYVALSAFRLAPIQVITPGHPATSLSPCIDYIVSDGDLFGDERNYSEKLVGLPVGGARYIGRKGIEIPGKIPAASPSVYRFAVPAMATKLIPPFLATLKRIKAEASRPVEFHFFPNMVGMSHDLITKDLRRWIPDAVIHQRADYQAYVNNLAKCDAMLSTFPFGATNSAIDAFLCGLPVVTLEGDQIHSKSDASMLRRLGLEEKTIARNVDEYVDIALGLISGVCVPLMPTTEKVEREFFGPAPAGAEGAFLKAFEQIYADALEGK